MDAAPARREGPLVREVGQSFYLMGLLGATIAAPIALALWLVRLLG